MNSDNTINIIPLSDGAIEAPLISSGALSVIRDMHSRWKKTLLFYSRRWTARAWLCQDCGHYEKCPHCDIAYAYHTSPIKRLVCHQCNHERPFPLECPNCHGHNITGVGIGIEKIHTDLTWLLTGMDILRIDGDSVHRMSDTLVEVESADVILATSLASTLVHRDIGAVVFLSFELNLSLPEYDIEEQLYDEILYYKKQHLPIYLQTYTPEHPLLDEILHGNQRSFFDLLKKERKLFAYPPYSQFVTIRVHHDSQQRVQHMMNHLIQKIHLLKWDEVFFAADRDIWERRGGEWSQKILLKWQSLASLVAELEIEVVRNRSVSLEWN